MNSTLKIVLYLIAAICFGLASFGVTGNRTVARINLVALGLLAWVMVPLLTEVL